MPTLKKRINFFQSPEGVQVEAQLRLMAESEVFNTEPTYSANTEMYPNNMMPFVDKHMFYLQAHPGVNPVSYVANLRLMSRIRGL